MKLLVVACAALVGCQGEEPSGGVAASQYRAQARPVRVAASSALGRIRITSSAAIMAGEEAQLKIAFIPHSDIAARVTRALEAAAAKAEEAVHEGGIDGEGGDGQPLPPSIHISFPAVSSWAYDGEPRDPTGVLGKRTDYRKSTSIALNATNMTASSTFTLNYRLTTMKSFTLTTRIYGMEFDTRSAGEFRLASGSRPRIEVAAPPTPVPTVSAPSSYDADNDLGWVQLSASANNGWTMGSEQRVAATFTAKKELKAGTRFSMNGIPLWHMHSLRWGSHTDPKKVIGTLTNNGGSIEMHTNKDMVAGDHFTVIYHIVTKPDEYGVGATSPVKSALVPFIEHGQFYDSDAIAYQKNIIISPASGGSEQADFTNVGTYYFKSGNTKYAKLVIKKQNPKDNDAGLAKIEMTFTALRKIADTMLGETRFRINFPRDYRLMRYSSKAHLKDSDDMLNTRHNNKKDAWRYGSQQFEITLKEMNRNNNFTLQFAVDPRQQRYRLPVSIDTARSAEVDFRNNSGGKPEMTFDTGCDKERVKRAYTNNYSLVYKKGSYNVQFRVQNKDKAVKNLLAANHFYYIVMHNPNDFRTGDKPKVIIKIKKNGIVSNSSGGMWGFGGITARQRDGQSYRKFVFERDSNYFRARALKPILYMTTARTFGMLVNIESNEEGGDKSDRLRSNNKNPTIKVVPSGSCFFNYGYRR